MKITVRNLPNFGLAVLFAGALFALAIPSLRPLFRPSATGALGSSRAPVWELKDPEGKLVKSSDFDGKVVILDFWATWCPPCKAEIPGFIELQKKYGAKGLVVVGVSLDEQGPSVVKQFMTRFAMNYPVVMGNLKIMQDFGGTGITDYLYHRSERKDCLKACRLRVEGNFRKGNHAPVLKVMPPTPGRQGRRVGRLQPGCPRTAGFA